MSQKGEVASSDVAYRYPRHDPSRGQTSAKATTPKDPKSGLQF